MAQCSKIEWTEVTWNPVTGCTKISEGCKNCYAERMAARLEAMGNNRYRNGFNVTLHHDLVHVPLKWKKPRKIFVNSMSDLFHKNVPLSFIKSVFLTMEKAHWHSFQVVTKRSERLAELANDLSWPSNVWMGVTVESKNHINRIDDLCRTPAAVKFLSIEPLLSALPELLLDSINWIIVGGESGYGARPMDKEWVMQIKEQCIHNNVPFFFKQWGGINKKKSGRLLEGRIWDQMPKLYDSQLIGTAV